jgi:hypothetical protein
MKFRFYGVVKNEKMNMKMKALETLSDSKRVYISKGKEYEIKRKDNWNYFTIDNHGNELTFTEEAVRYKFEKCE